jgi:hypothetical protein
VEIASSVDEGRFRLLIKFLALEFAFASGNGNAFLSSSRTGVTSDVRLNCNSSVRSDLPSFLNARLALCLSTNSISSGSWIDNFLRARRGVESSFGSKERPHCLIPRPLLAHRSQVILSEFLVHSLLTLQRKKEIPLFRPSCSADTLVSSPAPGDFHSSYTRHAIVFVSHYC